jgi:hypothetical protein
VANLGVDVCATAELAKTAQVSATSIARAVMGIKGPLRTKYLLSLGLYLSMSLVGLVLMDRYNPVVQLAGDGLSGLGTPPRQLNGCSEKKFSVPAAAPARTGSLPDCRQANVSPAKWR